MREAGVFTNLDAPKSARTRYFRVSTNDWAIAHGFPYQLLSEHTKEGAPVKFGKTRAYVVVDEGEGGLPVVETWKISGLQFWNQNPEIHVDIDSHNTNPLSRTTVAADSQRKRASKNAKGKTTTTKAPSRRLMARRRTTEAAPKGFYANPLSRVKINSPSIATGEPPSARLKKRRQKTAKAPAGIWANPITHSDMPGDFSQSTSRVLGRAWTDAKTASIKDFGDCARVQLTWPDGEWLAMLFDTKQSALKQLQSLGFKVQK